jgi:prophage antirepressor-like protein
MNTNKTSERESYQLVPFTYEDHAIRMVMIDDSPWFIAKDVCDALGVKQPTRAVEEFPQNEKGVTIMHTLVGKQEMLVVNEPGLYRLIFQSRKPEAEWFKTWVFTEVLPAIRRNGTYQTPEQRELFAKLQRMGSPSEVMTLALMGRIYQRAGTCRMNIQQMYHIMELALAKSELTGEYIMAKDVARAVRCEGLAPYSLIERYVTEIRAAVVEYGFVPNMVRQSGGNYTSALESPSELAHKEAAAINAKIKVAIKAKASAGQPEALFAPEGEAK